MREFAPRLSRPPPDWQCSPPPRLPRLPRRSSSSAASLTSFSPRVFTYVFLANAWLGDDAYITFRVVWNFVHGYGPVFNPGERVQAYTHPLWMLVMSAAHFVTRDFFFTAQVVSYGFVLAALLRMARRTESAAAAAVVFVWVLSSKAFMDYASSGLEYPLSYCLLAFFYTRWFAVADRPLETRDLRRFGFVAGLAFVNRIDSVLLYAVPLAWLALRTLRVTGPGRPPSSPGLRYPPAHGCCSRRFITASRCRTRTTPRSRPASRRLCSTGRVWRTSSTASPTTPSR